MLKKLIILFLTGLLLTACGQASEEEPVPVAKSPNIPGHQGTKYLAYEHSIGLEMAAGAVSKAYQETIKECESNKASGCTVLNTRISEGDQSTNAYIQMRMKPEAAGPFIDKVSQKGKVLFQSTSAEDLAGPIVDNERKVKMLKNHWEKLEQLQAREDNDIDSLLKIATEMSRVQSELEAATGQNEYLMKRVNMDIVNIRFQTPEDHSFWNPVSGSFGDFSRNLSLGISGTIVVVAYLLPGIILILVIYFVVRFFRRRSKRKKTKNNV